MKITDPSELADRQRGKRKGFEDDIRKNRAKMTNWLKYAAWEENQREYDRARYSHTYNLLDILYHSFYGSIWASKPKEIKPALCLYWCGVCEKDIVMHVSKISVVPLCVGRCTRER